MTTSSTDYGNALGYGNAAITSAEFGWIQNFLRQRTGIDLKAGKEALVVGRLERRLRHHGLDSFSGYIHLLRDPAQVDEVQVAVDLLTTNETYFFREPDHFDRLGELLASRRDGPVRVWSAASSSGEEAYTIALTLASSLGKQHRWEVLGTDISTRVLEKARRGLYPVEASEQIPADLLRAHCLRGRDELEGLMTFRSELRERVSFRQVNLTQSLPDLGMFDVVFLRNVMIYFGQETKAALIGRIVEKIRPGGHLLIGHAESIGGLSSGLESVAPSVYRRVDA